MNGYALDSNDEIIDCNDCTSDSSDYTVGNNDYIVDSNDYTAADSSDTAYDCIGKWWCYDGSKGGIAHQSLGVFECRRQDTPLIGAPWGESENWIVTRHD